MDHIRKKGREKGCPNDNLEPVISGRVSGDTAGGRTDKAEIKKIVHRVVSSLPVHYRIVITLYHLEDCSYREIAQITGMPEGTVKSYISRAREMIREHVLKLVPDIQVVLFEH